MTRSPPGRQGSGPMRSRNSVLATSNSERKSRRSWSTPTTRARFWRCRPSRGDVANDRTLVGRRFGLYSVRSPLGAGGMGEVYRARDDSSDATSPSRSCRAFTSDTERMARFQREARPSPR